MGSKKPIDKSKAKTGMEKTAQAAEDKILNELRASLDSDPRSATFACGGSIPFKQADKADKGKQIASEVGNVKEVAVPFAIDPVQIFFGQSGKGITATIPTADGLSNELLELVAACQTDTSGCSYDDLPDEYDFHVGELDKTEFTTSFCPYTTGIVDVVAQLLVPEVTPKKHLCSLKVHKYGC